MKRLIYTKEKKDIIEVTGLTEDELWKHISFDDWDYAFLVAGRIPKNDSNFDEDGYGLLKGCCSNKWKYIAKINMTIGMAYHA